MLRTALRPRWLALLAIVLLAATGMSLLGRWQLDRAREHGAHEAARSSVSARPVQDVLPARATFPTSADGARVTATGSWDGAQQLLIADRKLNGRNGFWVLVPVRLSDGSAVGVVRGWVGSSSDPAAAAPSGPVTVTGLLQPTEPPVDRAPGQASGLPEGQLEQIAVTDLIAAWPYPLITGYVLAGSEQPANGAVPQRVPPPAADSGLDWRNLAYAIQWWLFAGFGVFMWWRVVRDDHETRSQPGSTPETPFRQDDNNDEELARGVAP